MSDPEAIFIGIDGGATTSKIAAVRADSSVVSMDLLQRPTGSELYDLSADPWETNDLLLGGLLLPAEQQAYLELEARMAEILGG